MSDRTQKLVSIRHRTDQDLLVLVQRDLDRGFALVNVAASRNSPLFAQAEKALATATAMFPRIAGMSECDGVRIGARLKELRSRLDQVPAYANLRRYPESVAS